MDRPTILLVEDELISAKDIQSTLEESGYHVPHMAKSGEEALKLVSRHPPDLIIMDIMLAGPLNGIETAGRIHHQFDIPVIFLTAYADDATFRDAVKTHPHAYVLKPVDHTELLMAVKTTLQRHSLEKKLHESEQQLERVLEASDHGFWDWDLNTNEGYYSPRYYTMLGYEPNEFPMNFDAWKSLLHPDDREWVMDSVNSCLEELCSYDLEFRLKSKSGAWRWIHSKGKFFDYDQDGRPHRMIGIHIDITDRKIIEEALRQSEQQYRFVAENATDVIFIQNNDMSLSYASPSATTLLGYTLDELKQMSMQEYMTPGSYQQAIETFSAEYQKAMQGIHEDIPLLEFEYVRKDGSVFWGEIKVTFLWDAEGLPYGSLGILRDITPRKKAEEKTRTISRLYNVLSHVNQRIVKTRDRKELLLKVCDDIIEFGMFQFAWIGITDPTSGQVVPMASSGDDSDFLDQFKISTKNGKEGTGASETLREGNCIVINDIEKYEMNSQWKKAAIEHGFRSIAVAPIKSRNEMTGALNIYSSRSGFFDREEVNLIKEVASSISFALDSIYDEEERLKAEEALRESEKRWKFALEGSQDGVWDWNADTGTVFFSGMWKEMLGYSDSDISGTLDEWKLLIHPDDRDEAQQALAQHLDGTRSYYYSEHRMLCKDGSYRWILDRGKVISRANDGTPQRIIGTQSDISERKKLEEQLFQAQKMDSLGRLAGGIAHDLNNLLTPILGYAELLQNKTDMNPSHNNDLHQIQEAALRARELTQQLLAFGRKQVLEIKTFDLSEIVRDYDKILRRTIRENIQIELETYQHPVPVRSDMAKIGQIIVNLAINAQDAMPDGGKLKILTSRMRVNSKNPVLSHELEEGDYALLQVSDTGKGIDRDTLKYIFEPFYTTKKIGTGLGLSTVYGIVKQHGGTIKVESIPGKGTTFTVYLPISTHPAQKHEITDEEPENMEATETILVVEDEETVRKLVVKILETTGYNVLSAHNGDRAIEIASNHKDKIDMLLTDVIMPGKNGIEVYKEISALRKDIKVLYMSGYTYNIIADYGVAEDSTNFIQKPLTVNFLTSKVREILDS
ncbi:MAG: PAS domain-containing protein [Spirochaetota bacterium]